MAAFTKIFCDEYGKHNIRMNNVLPGWIDSLPKKDERQAAVPLQRYGKAEEIGATVAFLASEGAALTLRGVGHPNDITDGTLVLAEFSTRAPLAAAFRKTGVISLSAAGDSVKPPPAPKGAVRKFLGACK